MIIRIENSAPKIINSALKVNLNELFSKKTT